MAEKKLRTRRLGKSGIEVTEIGIGLWAIGGDWGGRDDQAALSAIDAALDAGITFYDTADVYGGDTSEELLGKAMKGRRDRFVVATKIGWRGFDGENYRTQYDTVEKLIEGVEGNLRRLGTDYVDVIQDHIPRPEPNMGVFIEGFQKLMDQGKVRAYGVSTSDLDYLKEFNADGKCCTLQIDYSILNRTPEEDILPYCREKDIGVIIRGALGMGILTGKFSMDTQFAENDVRKNWTRDPQERATFMADLEKVERLRPLSNGRSLAQLALQFVLAHPAVSVAIPGGKNEKQVRDNVQAGLLDPLSGEEMETINEVVPPGGGRKIWPA